MKIIKRKFFGFTPRTKKVLENASDETKRLGTDYIGTEHILIGIIKEGDSIAIRILLNLNANLNAIYEDILKIVDEPDLSESIPKPNQTKNETSFSETPTLNQFGTDLCENAKKGLLDPIIGRKEEIERVIQILTRRTKNNPCLIGEPGVGKTAIAEGLALLIVSGEVPQMLKNKRIVNLDISSVVAGAKYRGDFEDRIKKILNEVRKVKNVILFIDEIHTIVGAGSAEGAIDAANILKPILARGEISLIGATTLDEYRKYIEKDSALERRFSPVIIEEPSVKDTIAMIEGIRDKYEAHHNVRITDEAISASVNLSNRYISDRFLPDKAIDVIDEAASNARMIKYTRPNKLKNLEVSLEKMKQEKEEAIRMQDFEKAAELRDKEGKGRKRLEKEKEKWNDENAKAVTVIDADSIAEVISKWTNIPVKKITQDENVKLKNLENELHKRVIGQNQAIEAVSKCIRRGRARCEGPKSSNWFIFISWSDWCW
jgi:ATP-dependent Clp protease ATP-binding subunit ClpC